MIAIENTLIAPEVRGDTPRTGQIVLFSVLISALIAAASLTMGAGDGSLWPLAAEMVGRFSLLLFVASIVAEPVARLIPSRATEAAGRERGGLVLGFIAASAISLICVAAPSQLGGEPLTAPAIAYCMLTGAILVVMLFSAHPATLRFLGGPAWRSFQRIATAYFWLAFALTGISHLIGPHRPDDWHGFSLLLLIGAFLLRFTDTFVTQIRGRMAVKVG